MNTAASSSVMTPLAEVCHPHASVSTDLPPLQKGGRGEFRASQPLLAAVDARLRLGACGLFALTVVGLTQIPALLTALALSGCAALAAHLEPVATLRRMAALDGFMLFILLFLPFTVPGEIVFSLRGMAASHEGVLRAAEILLKANAVGLMIVALLSSMEPVELGHAMARLRLPVKFVHLFLFTLRYIEVLGREYRRLRTAMKARGFRPRCDPHTWRSVGYLFGMLLVRGIERAERILAAMRCRGFQGHFHLMTEAEPMGRRDYAFASLSVAAACALIILEFLH